MTTAAHDELRAALADYDQAQARWKEARHRTGSTAYGPTVGPTLTEALDHDAALRGLAPRLAEAARALLGPTAEEEDEGCPECDETAIDPSSGRCINCDYLVLPGGVQAQADEETEGYRCPCGYETPGMSLADHDTYTAHLRAHLAS